MRELSAKLTEGGKKIKDYDRANIPLAKELRKNMTPWERKLWYNFLRDFTPRFQRQKAIGIYIVDFYCAEAHLAIELDGSGHYDTAQKEKDILRTSELENMGVSVLRINNNDIDNKFSGVCEHIERLCKPTARMIMQSVTIYTDGACSGNPGPGGWAAVLRAGEHEKELSGGEALTTNNKMELTAVISALEALRRPCEVTLYTDSQYIEKAINQHWLDAWKKRGWRRKDGELKNADLWQRLDGLLAVHSVTLQWVRGHDGDEYNERCDALAVAERERFA